MMNYMKKVPKTAILSATALLCMGGLFVAFLFINPIDKPLIYVFIPVVLFWGLLFSVIHLVSRVIYPGKSKVRSILIFVSVTTIVLLLLLSGVGQLTVGDVVLTVCLSAISSFYFYRSWG